MGPQPALSPRLLPSASVASSVQTQVTSMVPSQGQLLLST